MRQAVPFQWTTADGSVCSVKHPDFVSVSEGEDGVVVVHTEAGLAILALPTLTAPSPR